MDRKVRNLGYLEGFVSSVLNTVLFAVKLMVGIAVGSVAMTADAWHTLSDTLTSLVVIVGFWAASRPKDQKHPFGHGRAESIGALILGILLAVVGLNFCKESFLVLWNREPPPLFTPFAIGVFAVSALLKEALAQFSFWAGRKIHSQALIGDGWHHRSDALASLVIVLGALLGGSLWWLDGAMGMGVSFLIVWVAVDIVKNTASELMGDEMDEKLCAEIRNLVINTTPAASKIHHIHFHRYGRHREITLHVHIPGAATLQRSHEIASAIESRLQRDLQLEATVHMEPCEDCNLGEDLRCADENNCLDREKKARVF